MELLIDSLKAELLSDPVKPNVDLSFSGEINDYDEVFYEEED